MEDALIRRRPEPMFCSSAKARLPGTALGGIVSTHDVRDQSCLEQREGHAMAFKRVEVARRSWRRLGGPNQLPKVVLGAKFRDGLEVATPTDRQPEAAA